MTMHKAKGLQFDLVILPSLGRPPRSDTPSLLRAMERPLPDGSADLLLAPIRDALGADEPIYEYLGLREKEKGRNEASRVLYVACTQARDELHLVGHTNLDADGKPKDSHGQSLLAKLWPAVAGQFEAAASSPRAAAPPHPQSVAAALRGLGLSGAPLEQGVGRVERALLNVLADERARWILDPDHQGALNEQRLTALLGGEVRNLIVDRTFVENGVRWIIDYKTGFHRRTCCHRTSCASRQPS